MTTKDLGKNPVSEPHALRQETGFLPSLWVTTKYLGKNPVSEPHALRQETGFFTKSVGDNEVFRKKLSEPHP
ncbi:MAG: hypothetical protein EAZ18_08565 [Oscillatoriales cyanobacterium]|nr:MAG: hypothetical protein EAZ18_08565 [Oscillatoriales cyanobacterium]